MVTEHQWDALLGGALQAVYQLLSYWSPAGTGSDLNDPFGHSEFIVAIYCYGILLMCLFLLGKYFDAVVSQLDLLRVQPFVVMLLLNCIVHVLLLAFWAGQLTPGIRG